jgi:hypothetical protein
MIRTIAMAGLALVAAPPAAAMTTIFSGQDDGVAVDAPFPASLAAQIAFQAAAASLGTVTTDGFETAMPGFYSPLLLEGVSIFYDTNDLGAGLSGVTTSIGEGALFGFNTTPGGAQWFGFPDFVESTATFQFDTPAHAFGFFTTGVQAAFTSALTLQLLDGSVATFDLPVNVNGGVSYFGVVDTIGFTRVSLSQASRPGYADAWGIDDISYTTGGAPAIPEPSAWALMIVGLGAAGIAARSRGRRCPSGAAKS